MKRNVNVTLPIRADLEDVHKALPKPWLLVERTTPVVHARNASLPTDHPVWPSRRIGTMSPHVSGARRTSPGPVNVDSDIYRSSIGNRRVCWFISIKVAWGGEHKQRRTSPPVNIFFALNLRLPLMRTLASIATMLPGFALIVYSGWSCTYNILLLSRWSMRNCAPSTWPVFAMLNAPCAGWAACWDCWGATATLGRVGWWICGIWPEGAYAAALG